MQKGASVLLVSTLVFVVLQFLTRVAITHSIALGQWGEFSVGLAFASMLSLLGGVGIPAAVARSLAFESTADARREVVRRASAITTATAVGASLVVFAFAEQIASIFHGFADLPGLLRLFSVTIACSIGTQVLTGFFQGLERAEPNALFNQIVNPALFLAFAGGFLLLGWGFNGVLFGYVISWIATLVLLLGYTAAKLPPLLVVGTTHQFEGDATGRVGFGELALVLFGVATLAYLTSFADTLILAVYRVDTIVGQYSASMTLARLFLVGSGAVTYIYLPVASRLRRQGDYAAVRDSYITSSRWVLAATLPMFFLFFFDPQSSLAFAFGRPFIAGAQALQVLVIASFAAVVLGPAPSCLGGLGRARSMAVITAISAATNFALSFALIPPYGLLGAAIAWSVGRIVYPGLCLAVLWVGYGISPFAPQFVRPLVLSSAILVPLFLLFAPDRPFGAGVPLVVVLPLLFVASIVVYVGSIVVTRSVEESDLGFLSALERRLRRRLPALRHLLESHRIDSPLPGPSGTGGG